MNNQVYRIDRQGGPEVLELINAEVPAPAPRQILLRQQAIGLNFIDTYHRSGLYPLPLPSGLGLEAAGIVAAVGSEVRDLKVGDGVVYYRSTPGSYARYSLVEREDAIKLDGTIAAEIAAASLLKGLTACYLVTRTYRLAAGETILVHAAAGGVGMLLTQWAKHLGARIIATVGSEEKARLARAQGCDEVILYHQEEVAPRVRELTNGEGVAVVYDSVGRATFNASLQSLARFGLLVSFGNASGPVEPFSPLELMKYGSLYITRPALNHHAGDRQVYRQMAAQFFGLVASGAIKVGISQRYAFEQAAQAHRDMEAARTKGLSVLLA